VVTFGGVIVGLRVVFKAVVLLTAFVAVADVCDDRERVSVEVVSSFVVTAADRERVVCACVVDARRVAEAGGPREGLIVSRVVGSFVVTLDCVVLILGAGDKRPDRRSRIAAAEAKSRVNASTQA
jgi:hypothetical protein